jgi:hypothetical protein
VLRLGRNNVPKHSVWQCVSQADFVTYHHLKSGISLWSVFLIRKGHSIHASGPQTCPNMRAAYLLSTSFFPTKKKTKKKKTTKKKHRKQGKIGEHPN